MRSIRFSFLFSLGFLFYVSAHALDASDQIESLITKQQTDYKTWEAPGEDLPPVLMMGDKLSVTLSQSTDSDPSTSLCNNLDLDQLFDLSSTSDPTSQRRELNLLSPRIQDLFGDACLIRPDDEIMAIGPGQQIKVALKSFFVEVIPSCPGQTGYALSANFDSELPFDPFIFSSDSILQETENSFRLAVSLSSAPIDATMMAKIRDAISYVEEYQLTVYQPLATNTDLLIHLGRTFVKADDEGFPNEIILSIIFLFTR